MQQRRVAEKAAPRAVEQVALDDAARGLTGLDADEACESTASRLDLAGRQPAPDRRGALLPMRHLERGRLLRRVVVGERQRHQLVEVDAVFPVQREKLRRQRGQHEPALHRQWRHAEARCHVFDPPALVDHRLEGVELVGGMQWLVPAVLGDADFERALGRHQFAQHLV
jgi:hypothetical protein